MGENLGEIFYNSRVINLESAEDSDLEKIYQDLSSSKAQLKEKIEDVLLRMKRL